MMLRELLKDCVDHGIRDEVFLNMEIKGLAYDSRKVGQDCLFVAIKGERHNGHDYIREALNSGANSVIYELNNSRGETFVRSQDFNAFQSKAAIIGVQDSRKALACIANNYFRRPSEQLILIGVTGTNGKTTTTYILKSILESWGKTVGLVGTIHHMIKDKEFPAYHTTPEALEFQELMNDMLIAGCTHVIAEVSSHALAQYRVDHSAFRVAGFTNLTRDHLDFHKTVERYFQAKERLFHELLREGGIAVLNIDDPFGRQLYTELETDKMHKKITYGLKSSADITARDVHSSFQGLDFTIIYGNETHRIRSKLSGITNVYNILAAVGLAVSLDIPWHIISRGVELAETVRGRFEKIDLGQKFLCVVDYAHSEDALERLITTARELSKTHAAGKDLTQSRIITVFGCGGDRDRGKRPKMGEIATRLSDLVIITSDNPRSEEPADIIKDVEKGAVKKNYLVEPNRREAIQKALDMAEDGDIVLVAGKGHEDYQEIKGVRYQFNDRTVVEEIIREKRMRRTN